MVLCSFGPVGTMSVQVESSGVLFLPSMFWDEFTRFILTLLPGFLELVLDVTDVLGSNVIFKEKVTFTS